jgi:hypothetical protein
MKNSNADDENDMFEHANGDTYCNQILELSDETLNLSDCWHIVRHVFLGCARTGQLLHNTRARTI